MVWSAETLAEGPLQNLEEGVGNPFSFSLPPPTGHTTTTSSIPSGSRTEEERPGRWAKSSFVSAERKAGVLSGSHFLTPRTRQSSPRVFFLFAPPVMGRHL